MFNPEKLVQRFSWCRQHNRKRRKRDVNNKETRWNQSEACIISRDAAQVVSNLGKNLGNNLIRYYYNECIQREIPLRVSKILFQSQTSTKDTFLKSGSCYFDLAQPHQVSELPSNLFLWILSPMLLVTWLLTKQRSNKALGSSRALPWLQRDTAAVTLIQPQMT